MLFLNKNNTKQKLTASMHSFRSHWLYSTMSRGVEFFGEMATIRQRGITLYRNTSSCFAWCSSVMVTGGLAYTPSPNSYGFDPLYAKCYTGVTSAPPNGIRLAFPSQMGTSAYDPAVPQITPITNVSACLGKILLYYAWHFFD